jgi:hypothetical protein
MDSIPEKLNNESYGQGIEKLRISFSMGLGRRIVYKL